MAWEYHCKNNKDGRIYERRLLHKKKIVVPTHILMGNLLLNTNFALVGFNSFFDSEVITEDKLHLGLYQLIFW